MISKLVKETSDLELAKFLNALIAKTHLECGQIYDEKQFAATLPTLVNTLKNYFSTFCVNEISLAFENGWKEKYGKYYGLCNATFYKWLRGYMDEVDRAEIIKIAKEILEKNLLSKVEISENEKNKILEDGCLTLFQEYKSNKSINIFHGRSCLYDFLDKEKKLINFTVDIKNKAMHDAKEYLITQKQLELTKNTSIIFRNHVKNEIEQIKIGKYPQLVFRAKEICLKWYFDSLIEMDIELFNNEN